MAEIDAIVDQLVTDLTGALDPSTGDTDAQRGGGGTAQEESIARYLLHKAKVAQRRIDQMGSAS